MTQNTAESHPFLERPHRTLIALAIPVTLSILVEPITGMVDTAFVSDLGEVPLAALGVGTVGLSTVFWIFNFLGISTQTEVSRALGRDDAGRAAEITSLALMLGAIFSVVMIAVVFVFTAQVVTLLGAEPAVKDPAITYIRVRLFGAPAVIALFILLGALRGLQDMRTQLYVTVSINVLNIVLDGPFIFGWGPLPAMGVGGAALASAISQWIGMLWALSIVVRRLGFVPHLRWHDVRALLRVGGDLFIRTGLLTLFMLLSTRVANQIGAEAGAAHQAVRTVWLFFGLIMEGLAITAQSLVGYFMGAGFVGIGLQVATLSARWSVGVGIALAGFMLLSTELFVALLVPPEAVMIFGTAWLIAALTQPLMAMAFVTDGIHWGTGDYTFLRNAMLTATVSGGIMLLLIDTDADSAFTLVWVATAVWVGVRAALGIVRVWPGIGASPLREMPAPAEITPPDQR